MLGPYIVAGEGARIEAARSAAVPAGLCGGLHIRGGVQRARGATAAALPGGRLGHRREEHCCRAALQPP